MVGPCGLVKHIKITNGRSQPNCSIYYCIMHAFLNPNPSRMKTMDSVVGKQKKTILIVSKLLFFDLVIVHLLITHE